MEMDFGREQLVYLAQVPSYVDWRLRSGKSYSEFASASLETSTVEDVPLVVQYSFARDRNVYYTDEDGDMDQDDEGICTFSCMGHTICER